MALDVVGLWNALGSWTKLGLLAQAATCGLQIAALWKPTRALCAVALISALLGFAGLSLFGIGTAEYTICGVLDPPAWCSEASVGQ